MALKEKELQRLAEALNAELKGQRLSKVLQFDADVFSFSLSKSGRLVFSLHNDDPYVYVSSHPLEVNSLSTPLSMCFRKELSNALILGIDQRNEDRVLALSLLCVDDVYRENEFTLLAELIPGKANLVLVNEQGRVIAALHTNLITDPRPVFKGAAYEYPLKKEGLLPRPDTSFDYASYTASCEAKEASLQERRKKTRFAPLLKKIAQRKKSAERKIKAIQADMEEAQKHLGDGDYGSFIYMDIESIHPETGKMDYYGITVPLDPRKSASRNAEAFFLRAKKAKATLANGETYLAKAMEELERYEDLSLTIASCDEAALEKLAKEYGLEEKSKGDRFKSPLAEKAIWPYLVEKEGTRYLFGKNSSQNDFLSFLLATEKEHLWFHVKDNHGAHLVLAKKDPNDEEISFACCLALAASGLSSGEVMYTPHKNVRRGNVKGQAIVKEYKSAYFKAVPSEIQQAMSGAKKWAPKSEK